MTAVPTVVPEGGPSVNSPILLDPATVEVSLIKQEIDDKETPLVLVGRKENGVDTKEKDGVQEQDADDMQDDSGVQEHDAVSMLGQDGVKGHQSLVMPKCVLPPREELEPVETFVANAVSARHDMKEDKALQGYRAILDCFRRREDPPLVRKILLALRTAGQGTTLHRLTGFSSVHAHLLHLVFRLDPFTPPDALEDEKCRTYLDHTLADAHLHLIVALVSANSVFLTPGMNALWRMLTFSMDNAPVARTTRVHAALSTMLRLCPRGKSDLFPILASNFPFKTIAASQQVWYAQQCLAVLEYVPTIHGQVLELMIDKCLEMDVEIKIEDGGQVTIEEETNEMFELDMDEAEIRRVDEKKETVADKVDEMADKLDSLMMVVFEHVNSWAKSNLSAARQLYRMVSPVFDSSILTTHRSKFVQFIVLLLCGLENDAAPDDTLLQHPNLYREFAAKLIDIVLDPYRATVTRQSSACYLASFVSRASYVCAETVCESIAALLRWAETYIASLSTQQMNALRATDARDQCEMHSLFYTICQAAFYMMCFCGDEAIRYYRLAMEYHSTHDANEEDANIPYAEPEHVDIGPDRWIRLCGHHLQPLRYCLESVRGEFLHVAHVFELLDSQLLDRLIPEDQRMSPGQQKKKHAFLITTAATLEKKRMKGGVGGLGRGSNPLDSFFPFDPYLLRRSHQYIESFYKNWEGSVEAEDAFEHEGEAAENESHDGTSDTESDASSVSESEADDGESHPRHMPESVDSSAYLQGMSYTSTGSAMGTSFAENSSHYVTPQGRSESLSPTAMSKTQAQREVWAKEVKRSRAPSIENGSW